MAAVPDLSAASTTTVARVSAAITRLRDRNRCRRTLSPGGVSLTTRTIGLILEPEHRSVALSKRIGDTINNVNTVLAGSKKKDRPGVIITIMTDGEENSSRRFNNEQIKAMVKAAEAADWTFVFLGANIDAFSVGSTFGMSVSNSTSYSTANMAGTMASVSASTTRMRFAKQAGVSTADIYSQGLYTSEELKNMNKG